MSEKTIIRQQLKAQRQALTDQYIADHSNKICAKLFSYCQANSLHHVGCYLAFRGEVSLEPFFAQAFAAKINCAIPRLVHEKLHFHEYRDLDNLAKNRYGILEPLASAPLVDVAELDLLVIPSVAVTRDGCRLGMGAGYYDRMLAAHHARGVVLPRLLGVAYDFQVVAEIYTEPHDFQLDYIVTPSEVIVVGDN